MKYLHIFILLSVILVFFSCEKSEITVTTIAQGPVRFHFRGKVYSLSTNESVTIKDIPSASYEYTTIYTIPAGYTDSEAGESLSGIMNFYPEGTSYLIQYTSAARIEDTSITYVIGAAITSSHPKNSNPTSAQ